MIESQKLLEIISKYKIKYITDDSRELQSFSLFLAYKGINFDRRDLIPKILSDVNLKNIIILKDCSQQEQNELIDFTDNKQDIIVINVYKLNEKIGYIAKEFFHNKDDYFDILGVTGTNGKTSIVYLYNKVLELLGKKTGFIGTLGIHCNADFKDENNLEVINTTPGAIKLHQILAKFHKNGIEYINMEASSHALEQGRLLGVVFNTVIFTNLSHEHLDYHKNMYDYFKAKSKLFDTPYINKNTLIIINHDDQYGIKLLENLINKNCPNRIISYGSYQGFEDFKNNHLKNLPINYSCILNNYKEITIRSINEQDIKFDLETKLLGNFNISNLLTIIAALYSKGFLIKDILNAIKEINYIPGRLQQVESSNYKIYIDYAHTPDALENILKELKIASENANIICVFGCGGDRDKLKRPKMGKIATKYADKVIITDDNPRKEQSENIIKDIIIGLSVEEISKVIINPDRNQAIKSAINMCAANDIIVIAGKGHEEYQIYGDKKSYFSDFNTVKSILDLGEK